MLKLIPWIALSLSLLIGIVEARNLMKPQIKTLVLEKPQYEWVRSTCQSGVDWCMGGSDYIKHQMYMEGLKHEADCDH